MDMIEKWMHFIGNPWWMQWISFYRNFKGTILNLYNLVISCFAKVYRFPYITQLFIFLGISFDENCCLVSVWYSTWLSEVWYSVHLSKEREIINDKLLLCDSRENIDLWQFAYVDLNKSPSNCNFEKLSSGKFSTRKN